MAAAVEKANAAWDSSNTLCPTHTAMLASIVAARKAKAALRTTDPTVPAETATVPATTAEAPAAPPSSPEDKPASSGTRSGTLLPTWRSTLPPVDRVAHYSAVTNLPPYQPADMDLRQPAPPAAQPAAASNPLVWQPALDEVLWSDRLTMAAQQATAQPTAQAPLNTATTVSSTLYTAPPLAYADVQTLNPFVWAPSQQAPPP